MLLKAGFLELIMFGGVSDHLVLLLLINLI